MSVIYYFNSYRSIFALGGNFRGICTLNDFNLYRSIFALGDNIYPITLIDIVLCLLWGITLRGYVPINTGR